VTKINQPANPAIPGGVVPAVTSAFLNRLANPVHAPETTKSYAAIGQWEMFSKRLILTGGARQDDISSDALPFTLDPVTPVRQPGRGRVQPDHLVGHEHQLRSRGQGVTKWLDVYANTATNTVGAGGTNYDIFNAQPLPDQEGKGYDLGLRGFFWMTA
jgi:hypothetical protein